MDVVSARDSLVGRSCRLVPVQETHFAHLLSEKSMQTVESSRLLWPRSFSPVHFVSTGALRNDDHLVYGVLRATLRRNMYMLGLLAHYIHPPTTYVGEYPNPTGNI